MSRLQAVTIDGTVIEFDSFQSKKQGLKLQRKVQTGGGKQSKGKKQKQSKKKQQGQKQEQSSEKEVIIVDDDLDGEELEELVELEEEQSKKKQKQESGQSKKQSKKKQSKQGHETIGFIPFSRLMYVIPEEVTYNVDELDELPA